MDAHLIQLIVGDAVYDIERDVGHEHPDGVHDALDTGGSEVSLQRYLDAAYVGDWYDDTTGEHLGPDVNGLAMWWLNAEGEKVTSWYRGDDLAYEIGRD